MNDLIKDEATTSRKRLFSRREALKIAGKVGLFMALLGLIVSNSLAIAAGRDESTPRLLGNKSPDWIAEARIYGLAITGLKVDPPRMRFELDRALALGANVIEADSQLSDYLSDEDYATELQLIKEITNLAHEKGLKVVWYIPSLEVITANGVLKKNSFGRVHKDWLQLSFSKDSQGIFYGKKEFWVGSNDESAWFCPNSPYREWFKSRLLQLAKTGVDGLWVDVAVLGSIGAEWGCACNYCQEKFVRQTGLEFPRTFSIYDKSFFRYIQWRHETLTEFLHDCQEFITEGNSNAIVLAEVATLDHLGTTESGAEGSSMSNIFVVWEQDGASETTAMADASYDDWIAQYSSYKYCRGATMDRPSWAFSYGFNDTDAQLVMAGAVASQNNPYELRTPKMNTSVGRDFLGMMYNWVARYSKQIFRSKSLAPVAVLYSERNRDFLDTPKSGGKVVSDAPPRLDRQWFGSKDGSPKNIEYMGDYRGLSVLLYQHQIPTDIYPFSRVDVDLLKNYRIIVLPYMTILTEKEKEMLLLAVRDGATLIVSGPKPGMWNADGSKRNNSLWTDLLGDTKDDMSTHNVGKGRVCFWKDRVGRKYLKKHDKKITAPLLSWIKDAGVDPWVNEKQPVVVQPYIYEDQIIIHVLNYSWIGKLGNEPKPLSLELSIPWNFSQEIDEITQSEPQWKTTKDLSFSEKGGNVVIPLEVGINCLVVINLK